MSVSFQPGQFSGTLRTRLTEIRTTVRGRIDEIRARIQSLGVGGFLAARGGAPIKTYSKGFAAPRGGILSRIRATRMMASRKTPTKTYSRNRSYQRPVTRPPTPVKSYQKPAPIKTFSKKSLRATKTF